MTPFLADLAVAVSGSPAASILAKVTVTTTGALVAAGLARRSRAAVRHVLLAAAFALLVLVPAATILVPPVHVAVPIVAAVPAAPPLVIATALDPAAAGAPAESVANLSFSPGAPAASWPASDLLGLIWLAGAIVCLLPLLAGLWQVRALRRNGLPWIDGTALARSLALADGLRRRVDVVRHEAASGPMTCGVLRPVIVLPMDADRWSGDDLRRALVHELEHVRRGDWLGHGVARVVCAGYWFHPLVWIAWHRLALEAERACDDAVLQHAEATAYATQLVGLAQRLAAGLNQPLLAMANRDLSTRVFAVLDSRQRRGRAGLCWIAVACAACAVLVAAISPVQIVAAPQTPAAKGPVFEVASIKPCREEPNTGGQRRQEVTVTPGRVTVNCIPLQRIIFMAYAGIGSMDRPLLNDHPANPTHVRGGPGWMQDEKFTIAATAEGTPDRTVLMGPMLRALLEDRFQLKVHREREEVPMYALTVAKGGLRIKPLGKDGCTPVEAVRDLSREDRLAVSTGPKPICGAYTSLGDGANRTWHLGGETLTRFASNQLSSVLDRYVIDQTGVEGAFNIHLTFGLDENIKSGVFGGRGVDAPPAGIEVGPSIFTALEEQLGLKLERTRGPREFLVVDRVERPSPN